MPRSLRDQWAAGRPARHVCGAGRQGRPPQRAGHQCGCAGWVLAGCWLAGWLAAAGMSTACCKHEGQPLPTDSPLRSAWPGAWDLYRPAVLAVGKCVHGSAPEPCAAGILCLLQWSCCRCLSTMSWSSSAGALEWRLAVAAPSGVEAHSRLPRVRVAPSGPCVSCLPARPACPPWPSPASPFHSSPCVPTFWNPHPPTHPPPPTPPPNNRCSKNPRDHMVNVWGYSHLNFFAPMSRFGSGAWGKGWQAAGAETEAGLWDREKEAFRMACIGGQGVGLGWLTC